MQEDYVMKEFQIDMCLAEELIVAGLLQFKSQTKDTYSEQKKTVSGIGRRSSHIRGGDGCQNIWKD